MNVYKKRILKGKLGTKNIFIIKKLGTSLIKSVVSIVNIEVAFYFSYIHFSILQDFYFSIHFSIMHFLLVTNSLLYKKKYSLIKKEKYMYIYLNIRKV